jgi:hypothetical protein
MAFLIVAFVDFPSGLSRGGEGAYMDVPGVAESTRIRGLTPLIREEYWVTKGGLLEG